MSHPDRNSLGALEPGCHSGISEYPRAFSSYSFLPIKDWAFGGMSVSDYVCLFIFMHGVLYIFSVYSETLQKIKVGLNDHYLSIYHFM